MSKLPAYPPTTDAILRNWMNLSLWGASAAFVILLLFFSWTPEIKITVTLLVFFFNFLSFRLIKFEHDVRADINTLRSDLARENVHIVETADQRQFYKYMTAAITSAESRADVTRLEQTKPDDSHLQELKDYYETARHVVRKGRITVRRIVRIESPDALEWTIELLVQLGNCPNFGIASLRGMDPTALSLQIFDAKELLLVQPDSGVVKSGHQKHMLRIKGKRLAEAFSDYYDRVWSASILIKEGRTVYWNNLIEIAQNLSTQFSQKNDRKAVESITASIERLNEMSGFLRKHG